MGFKCSVLGHRFEEPGIVHEREPRGDEVITIRRKVMVCTLCGEQRVLAENKEITKDTGVKDDNKTDIDDTTDDSTRDDTDNNSSHEKDDSDSNNTHKMGNSDSDNSYEENDSEDTIDKKGGMRVNEINDEMGERSDIDTSERRGDGASVIDAPEESGGGGIDVVHEQGIAVNSTESSVDAREDDGIVLSDNEGGRGYGEWPDDSKGTADNSKGTGTDNRWEPDALRGPSAFESTEIGKNGHTGPSTVDAETDTGEILTDDESDEETGTETETETETEAKGRAERKTGERTIDEFCCPSCGFTVDAPDSPFRSGDSCPKCRNEYLIDKR
jgi:predicted Zn-ribbon and HTH transcriptional regulator